MPGGGDHPSPCGLEKLPRIRELGWILLVEGEANVWMCWAPGIPCLDMPSKSTWQRAEADHLAGLEGLIWQALDAEDCAGRLVADLPASRVLIAPGGAKGPSEGHIEGHDPAALGRTLAAQQVRQQPGVRALLSYLHGPYRERLVGEVRAGVLAAEQVPAEMKAAEVVRQARVWAATGREPGEVLAGYLSRQAQDDA